MWERFLEKVWGKNKGWAFLAYSDDGNFHHKAYEYPRQLKLLLDEATQINKWGNVWFSVHLFQSPEFRRKVLASPVQALWIDYDSANPELIKPRPSICWRTSDGKHQAVWLLSEPTEPYRAEAVNKGLTYLNKGDKGGWHLGKVLRFPESLNYKYSPPQVGQILWDEDTVFDLVDLEALTKEVPQPVNELTPTKMPECLPALSDVFKKHGSSISTRAWELLNHTPAKDEDWSEKLWQLERLLLETGIPVEDVFVIICDSPWNKYARDGRPIEHLWAEIVKASLETVEVKREQEDGLPWVGLDSLLVYTKRPTWLVEGIWMASNVGWIAGDGKSYKSVASLDLAISVASGKPFLGKYPVIDPGPVLMVQEEDPLWRVASRVQVMAEQKGLTSFKISRTDDALVFEFPSFNQVPLYVSVGGGFNFQSEEKIKALEDAIDRYRPKLVILDPLFMLIPGIDEYKAGESVAFLNLLKSWRNKYGCAIAIVHHNRKGQGATHERLYGSMALYAWSENNLFITRKKDANVSVIERDIKDALLLDSIFVEYHDIDKKYSFTLTEVSPAKVGGGESEEKVASFLRSCVPNTPVSRKRILGATKLTDKTVTRILKDLEDSGRVELTYQGQGGQLYATPLVKLFDEEVY